ncbi:hypothetical protein [Hymenobacter guriensis]|uniref:DUF4249 family protein n=1 Tax=Hymenobacter guriensis TaxID=2793065 RepID=A0ABS0L593_9BACT|nr:hypothetical protein [Hymenobacter guriensis]MBG8555301.1 hypothetical protein [Hymenobacter guriensis]
MRNYTLILAGSFLLIFGCSPEPVKEYKLSAEQLAWQPYNAGDVLRFGNARNSSVRTFTITNVQDQLQEYSFGGNAPVYLGPAKKIKSQRLEVYARRTDTLRYMLTPASTPTQPDSVPYTYATPILAMEANAGEGPSYGGSSSYALVGWDIGFSNWLPLEQVISKQPLSDTTHQLLPSLRLGGIDYGPVLRVSNRQTAPPAEFPRLRPARLLYYAKDYGVVGFVEGSTLWYRLP